MTENWVFCCFDIFAIQANFKHIVRERRKYVSLFIYCKWTSDIMLNKSCKWKKSRTCRFSGITLAKCGKICIFGSQKMKNWAKIWKTGYHGNGGTFECSEVVYGSFTSKLMYMQNIKEIWIHACRTYMVNFWSLQIIDVNRSEWKSSIKISNNVGLRLSPCFTPRVATKGSLTSESTLQLYFVFEYMFLMRL